MKAINVQLRLLLKAIRYADSERSLAYYIRMSGYLDALQDTNTFDTTEIKRLDCLAFNAYHQRTNRHNRELI
ncbi:hypothetical protein [Pseudomonas sp. zfem005]|uniref:hypothetical protein n=1 Tax=Pseudomonas sp. zfem005 TaxID=3078200 RepID=UPI002928A1C9|nr:hypothetical protein [Pseudomonas sp. zfem005]MDU9414987.1 hypothetical protein [Pseudomonas sp. zfem005]